MEDRDGPWESVEIEGAPARSLVFFIDSASIPSLLLFYGFYISLNLFFLAIGWFSASPLARPVTSVPITYFDSAFRIPVDLVVTNLTRANRFLHAAVRVVRQDLIDPTPVTVRLQRTVATFAGRARKVHAADERSKAILSFGSGADTDFSEEYPLFATYLHSGVDRVQLNLSFLIDRDDIGRLDFVFSYVNSNAYHYRHELRFAMSGGLIAALLAFLVNAPRDVDAKTVFFCVLLTAAGVLGSSPIDRLFEYDYRFFEIAFDVLFVFVYRLVVFFQAYCLAVNRYQVRMWHFLPTALWLAGLGVADVAARYTEAAARIEEHVRPTGSMGDATDIWHLASLIAHGGLVFAVLCATLLKMRELYWARGSLVIVLLVTPMILDVIWDLQFPLFGILPYSSVQEISKAGCYVLGAILFIIGFTPVEEVVVKVVSGRHIK
jgi:hypothetical protein